MSESEKISDVPTGMNGVEHPPEAYPRGLAFGGRRLPRHERVRRQFQKTQASRVPTWAYALALVAFIAAWVALVTFV